jgi:hypothetical protein
MTKVGILDPLSSNLLTLWETENICDSPVAHCVRSNKTGRRVWSFVLVHRFQNLFCCYERHVSLRSTLLLVPFNSFPSH